MNKKLLFSSVAAFCFLVSAETKAADIAFNTARIQAMDKITGRVSEIDVPVNGLANFGTFSILVRKCVAKSPEETPENTAFVDVVDNYQTADPVNIFKGWMFSSTPALNAVEHPIYDIWLLKCYNRPQDRSKLLSSEQLALRDTIPMVRPQPIEVSTEIAVIEDKTEEQTPANTIQEDETNYTADEEFASEGEEDIPLPASGIKAPAPEQPNESTSTQEKTETSKETETPNEVILVTE